MGFWPVVMNVLKNSDVVLLLVDARMPDVTRNSEIVNKVEKMRNWNGKTKELLFIFNKSDLVNKSKLKKLKEKYKKAFFISGVRKTGVKDLKAYLENMADDFDKKSLRVGVVGYPNVGKSTLINLLIPRARLKVSSVSGTTKKTQWLRSGKLRIMDSPGVIPTEDTSMKMGIVSAKDPHKIRNPENVALDIIDFIMKEGKILEKFYGVESEKEPYDLFLAIGKKMNYLVKGGEINENRTAIRIISDWQRGKIKI